MVITDSMITWHNNSKYINCHWVKISNKGADGRSQTLYRAESDIRFLF